MKSSLIDVPVRINIWIRPKCQKAQWEKVRQARPSILFLQSDGGRNEKEWEAINSNRKLIDESIDWDCKVYRVYEDNNNGLYSMSRKVSKIIWENVDRCIFLEDDHIPSVSFFRFCAELLEKYKDDERIEMICGMNSLGVWERCDYDYFFAKEGSIWGTATWKRCSQNRDLKQINDFANSQYALDTIKNKDVRQLIEGYAEDPCYQNHVPGGEFWHGYNEYAQNRLLIIPKYNMIDCWGCGVDAEHASEYSDLPRRIKKLFYMKIYELQFPLKENPFVMEDFRFNYEIRKIFYKNIPKSFRPIMPALTLDINYLIGLMKKGLIRTLKKTYKYER